MLILGLVAPPSLTCDARCFPPAWVLERPYPVVEQRTISSLSLTSLLSPFFCDAALSGISHSYRCISHGDGSQSKDLSKGQIAGG
jgi:hypothetical protein